MIQQNNNLSVIPWYPSKDDQNARKWWVYGRVYPLYNPGKNLLPFQCLRPALASPLGSINYVSGYILPDGSIDESVTTCGVSSFDVTGDKLFLQDIPAAYPGGVAVAAYDENGDTLGTFFGAMDGTFTGWWDLPDGTVSVYVQVFNEDVSENTGKVGDNETAPVPVQSLKIYDYSGALIADITAAAQFAGLTVKRVPALIDAIVFPSNAPVLPDGLHGRYYLEMSDGVNTFYSDVITIVGDAEPYLKIEWGDKEDFVMDAGTIVYNAPAFRNVLYLDSDIAKPDYIFEDEGETRDGYFFPVKQISEKRYRFAYLAPEYLLDVMRFIRMADFVEITYHGKVYHPDEFLITPEWESSGDVATVTAEFDTATVAKKIGRFAIGNKDFNNDFNNDYK